MCFEKAEPPSLELSQRSALLRGGKDAVDVMQQGTLSGHTADGCLRWSLCHQSYALSTQPRVPPPATEKFCYHLSPVSHATKFNTILRLRISRTDWSFQSSIDLKTLLQSATGHGALPGQAGQGPLLVASSGSSR